MKRILLTAAVLAGIWYLSQGGFGLASSGPKITGSSRVLLIGDSLSVGIASHLGPLVTATGAQFQALGQSCSTILQWNNGACLFNVTNGCASNGQNKCAQLPGVLQSFRPDITIVMLGTNDSGPGVSGAELDKRAVAIAGLLQKIKAGGSQVFWVLPPTLPASSLPQRDAVSQLITAAVPKGYYLDSAKLSIPRVDTVHATSAGYDIWSQAIMGSLQ
jgi:lysophospholipase L1-like esterase